MKESINKKTTVTVLIVFAIILVAMLIMVPIQRRNEFRAKWGELAELAETDERARFITENEELYSERILQFFYSNVNQLDFVYNYAFHKDDNLAMSFTDGELNSKTVPALYMDDFRWCYQLIGDTYIKQNGCATLSLTMAYIFLTGNDDVNPYTVAQKAEAIGAVGPLGGIDGEKIDELCLELGLSSKTYSFCSGQEKTSHADPALLKKIIDSEDVLMAIMIGDTFGAHAIIITGYDGNDFIINDPASRENTARKWSFEELEADMFYAYDISKK